MTVAWVGAALVLLAALVAVGICCARAADQARGLVWMQLATVLTTMLLVVVAELIGRSIAFEAPLVFALTSVVGLTAFLRLRGGQFR